MEQDIDKDSYDKGVVDTLNKMIEGQGKIIIDKENRDRVGLARFIVTLDDEFYRARIQEESWSYEEMEANDKVYTQEEVFCIKNDWVQKMSCASMTHLVGFVCKTFYIGKVSMPTG